MKTIIQHYSDFIITLSAGFVVLAQYYLENIEGLDPCNLCIVQTFCARGIFVVYLIKIIFPYIKWLFDIIALPFLITGLVASGRQIYLQNVPADELAGGYCDMPLYLIFDMHRAPEGSTFIEAVKSYFVIVQKIFQGSEKCAEQSWFFLGLNIAEWSMIFFASMIVLLLLRYSLLIFKGQK